jgi:hypothetical protein
MSGEAPWASFTLLILSDAAPAGCDMGHGIALPGPTSAESQETRRCRIRLPPGDKNKEQCFMKLPIGVKWR